VPGTAQDFMYFVGAVEILAGCLVGLMLGALTLGRLASVYDLPLRFLRR
jgi:hypothetical protein